MALFVPDGAPRADPSQKALHFVPPTARERRAQAVHRLQVGLFGLAGMLLLVGLANIIMDRARVSEDAPAAASAAAANAAKVGPDAADPEPANDPLADIGVVPDLPAGNDSPAPQPSASAAPPAQ
jgi:hypothetical protein